MTLSLIPRSKDEIEKALILDFFCPAFPAALQRALAAEHIRAGVYSASASAITGGSQRVHTTRLMTNMRKNLGGFWVRSQEGNQTEDPYRTVIDDLNLIGDVVDTGGGFWIAAPLRLVDTNDPEMLLVFGGAPKEVVQAIFGARVECAATARFVRRAHLRSTAVTLDAVQSVDAWLGFAEPLAAWTQRSISFYVRQFSPLEVTSADALEIYAPDLYRDQRKVGRWMSASEIHHTLPEPRLCRPRAVHARTFDRPYYLGLFDYQHDDLVLRRSAQVSYEVSRRLRFGLDDRLKTARTATLSVGEEICFLDLRYALPEPENRVLALGWPGAGTTRAFHRAVMPAVLHALRRLSIDFTIIPEAAK